MIQTPPSSLSSTNTALEAIHKNRHWFALCGLLYLLSGIAAIIYPHVASVAIVQVIALLLIITGIVSFFAAIFSKNETQRLMHGLLALLRIVIGILILQKILLSLNIFTLILALFFLIEGTFGLVAAVLLKEHKNWVWLLLNAVITLLLGVLILAQYPLTASWAVGLLYGVNAVCVGITLLLLGSGGITLPNISTSHTLPKNDPPI